MWLGVSAVVGRVNARDVTDHALFNDLTIGLDAAGRISPAKSGDDRKGATLSHLQGFVGMSHARSVDGHRFLGEDVLAGFDRGTKMEGTEPRARREKDHVDVGVENALVRIQSDEFAIIGNVQLVRKLLVFGEGFERCVDLVREDIRHAVQFNIVIGAERLGCCAGPAPSCANESDFQLFRGIDTGSSGGPGEGRCRGGGTCGGPDKVTAIKL